MQYKKSKHYNKSREKVLELFNDCCKIASNAKYRSIYGEGHLSELATRLKILTLKQMFQRFPIALAQVKAGNISENLLNEIGQIAYYLYRKKEITKKVYKNILNSIEL